MDPRAAHTRALLHRAVLDLAAERALDDISVTQIVTRAGVNRSSFYQHFSNREELLASALETAEEAAGRVRDAVRIPDTGRAAPALVRFLAHFAEHAAVYRRALGPEGSSLVAARVRARTVELVREGIELSRAPRSGLPLDIEAAGTAGALLGVIEAWLSRDPLPAPEIAAEWMWRILTGPGSAADGDGPRPTS
ncbi:TetR/AcrR family transcriptional regulator [Leucobacter sp.]